MWWQMSSENPPTMMPAHTERLQPPTACSAPTTAKPPASRHAPIRRGHLDPCNAKPCGAATRYQACCVLCRPPCPLPPARPVARHAIDGAPEKARRPVLRVGSAVERHTCCPPAQSACHRACHTFDAEKRYALPAQQEGGSQGETKNLIRDSAGQYFGATQLAPGTVKLSPGQLV
jgi:hypothetical protein